MPNVPVGNLWWTSLRISIDRGLGMGFGGQQVGTEVSQKEGEWALAFHCQGSNVDRV